MENIIKKAIPAPFKKGVNFTVWLEFFDLDKIITDMYTKKDFRDVKSLGCDVVRLPIHFERFCKPENSYKIPEKLYEILDKVAQWAEELEIFVIFDFHNMTDSESHTSPQVEKILCPVWTQLAKHYKDSSRFIIYEIMNEPHDIEIPIWNQTILKVHNLIRTIDRNHFIIAGGADWNSFTAMKTLPDFDDDKIIYTFHFYDPHLFTHQGADWCRMGNVKGIPFPYNKDRMPECPVDFPDIQLKFKNYPVQGTVESISQFFDQYVEFSQTRNAPVYCGEFGAYAPFINKDERLNWYKIVVGLLDEKGIPRTCWDYWGPFGIFDIDYSTPGNLNQRKRISFPEDLNKELVKIMFHR